MDILELIFRKKKYQNHNFENCNFSIQIPEHLTLLINPKNECWINLINQKNNINIHLSYHKIKNNLDSLIKESLFIFIIFSTVIGYIEPLKKCDSLSVT